MHALMSMGHGDEIVLADADAVVVTGEADGNVILKKGPVA